MRRIMLCLFCFGLGAVSMYTAMTRHVVRTPEEVLLVPRVESGLHDTYCDIREWKLGEWREHPGLVRALVEHGRSDLVVNPGALNPFGDMFRRFQNAVSDATSSDPADRR